MSKIKSKTSYKCDVPACNNIADRHYKVKVPVFDTNLKKWKRFDMCSKCYMEFYRKLNPINK